MLRITKVEKMKKCSDSVGQYPNKKKNCEILPISAMSIENTSGQVNFERINKYE